MTEYNFIEASSSDSRLWGSYDEEVIVAKPKTSFDHLIEQGMQPNVLSEPEPLDKDIEFEFKDQRIPNTIALHQYYAKIAGLKNQFESNLHIQPQLPPPEPDPPASSKRVSNPFNFIPREPTDFSCGIKEEPYVIDDETARAVLKHVVTIMLAHINFTHSNESCLEVLTDAVIEFITALLRNLRVKVDAAAQNRPSQFPIVTHSETWTSTENETRGTHHFTIQMVLPARFILRRLPGFRMSHYLQFPNQTIDILEHAFRDFGMGSIRCVSDYYNRCVIGYENKMYQRCINIRWQYLNMIRTNRTTHRVKDEDMNTKSAIPELHVPERPEDGFNQENLPDLTPGLEILQTLEQEAAQQSQMSTDEELINSPAVLLPHSVPLTYHVTSAMDLATSPVASPTFAHPLHPSKHKKH